MKYSAVPLASPSFESVVDSSAVLNLANRRLKKIEQLQSPLVLRVLNLAANNLASLDDIQLW
jgi:hypothetical protein